MINFLIRMILIIMYLLSFTSISAALTEQEVEDEIDYKLGLRSFVHSKIETAGASANTILLQLLKKHSTNTARQRVIINFLSKNPEPNMISQTLNAYKINNELEDSIFGLLLKINTEDAYLAAKEIAFNPLLDAEKKGEDPLNNVRIVIYQASSTRLQYLIPHLKDGGFVSKWIIDAMMRFGSAEAIVPPIAELMKTEDEFTKLTAIEALGEIGHQSAISPLRNMLAIEKDLSIKMDIAAQLVKLGEFKELEALVQSVRNSSKDIREAAASWLKEVSGQDFGEDYSAWRKWFDDEKTRRGL